MEHWVEKRAFFVYNAFPGHNCERTCLQSCISGGLGIFVANTLETIHDFLRAYIMD